jgi:hypothetical protein
VVCHELILFGHYIWLGFTGAIMELATYTIPHKMGVEWWYLSHSPTCSPSIFTHASSLDGHNFTYLFLEKNQHLYFPHPFIVSPSHYHNQFLAWSRLKAEAIPLAWVEARVASFCAWSCRYMSIDVMWSRGRTVVFASSWKHKCDGVLKHRASLVFFSSRSQVTSESQGIWKAVWCGEQCWLLA